MQTKNLVKELTMDILPRAISILGIFLSAQIILNAFDEKDHYYWSEILERKAKYIENALSINFAQNLNKVYAIAETPALLTAFSDRPENIQDASKKALYEFKYLNEPSAAYIYDARTEAIINQTTGASPLPQRILSNLAKHAQENKGSYIDVVISGTKNELIFGGNILSPTGTVEGYALYTENFIKAIKQTRKETTIPPLVSADIIQITPLNTGILFENFSSGRLRMRQINTENAPRALFAKFFNQDFYKYPLKGKKDYLLSFKKLKDAPNWAISVSISETDMHQHTASERKLVWLSVYLIALFILILPISGPYTDALKSLARYIKLIFTKSQTETNIDANDLERMHLEKNALKQKMAPQRKPQQPKIKKVEGPNTNTAEIAYNIRVGMKNKRVKLLYQPIFETKRHLPVMYETYMRIVEETGEIIPPSLWLPVAKKENLFSLIDETVLGIATQRFFFQESPLNMPLTFNISGSTFESLAFMEAYTEKMSQNKLSKKVIFEVSSKEMITDKRAMNFMRKCRNLGFRFSVDYFGGGKETINVAKSLKFDFMKINVMRFDISKKEDRKELLFLAKTAEKINLPIIAERIEDKRMYLFCKKIGIPFLQGYFLGKPQVDLLDEVPEMPV